MGHTLDPVPAPQRPIAETDTAQLPERLGEEGDSAQARRLGQAMGSGQSPRRSSRKEGASAASDPPALRRGGHCELSPEVGTAGCWAGGPQAIETAERPADTPGGFRGPLRTGHNLKSGDWAPQGVHPQSPGNRGVGIPAAGTSHRTEKGIELAEISVIKNSRNNGGESRGQGRGNNPSGS